MTSKEAKRLLVGTVVMWNNKKTDLGTVRRISTTGFWVDWANGQQGWIDFRDTQKIEIR